MNAVARMSAEERKEAVVAAAARAFASSGYEATSTEEIARLAGISQPYIFRLFGTKRELFLAAVRRCFGRTVATFDAASQGLAGEEALAAMGAAYAELIREPAMLRLQMHAYAASMEDLEIRKATQEGLRGLWTLAKARSGADAETIRQFFATGMLCNLIVAAGLDGLAEPWAQDLMAAMAAKSAVPGITH
ncbi:MAG TPA: helix-turn-helix domain-containing protein [Acidimicrobiales bacterium]|nr:helix-turn-helix domain-containing protein [Acidimicrobiales bacterium]